MSLNEVRQKINIIDDAMKKLFDDRMDCSNQVAEVKMAEGDKVFKPAREKEIYRRFSDSTEYIAFVKKVMQISRKRQYEMFLDRKLEDKRFYEFLGDNHKALVNGGVIDISFMSDPNKEQGLNSMDMISLIADTNLEIKSLNVAEDGKVSFKLVVEDKEQPKLEALVLTYMLYEESCK